jgi:SWI/SNF-related matrix-associated actin-dependent regulator of chromatin subfamily A containing DEAD/H box 1
VLPAQSRDGTVSSRYFPTTPTSVGRILVPNSSPLPVDPPYQGHRSLFDENSNDTVPGLVHADIDGPSGSSIAYDPLSAPSGFVSNKRPTDAPSNNPWASNGVASSVVISPRDVHDGEPPRKRQNRGNTPPSPDPLNLLDTPNSPEILRPGQRRRPNTSLLASSPSSDESVPDIPRNSAGPSKPRLVRGERAPLPPISSTEDVQSKAAFLRFKFSQPTEAPARIQAAWSSSGGDETKAAALLSDPSWQPPQPKPPPGAVVRRPQESPELGRVKEVEDATKAERARVRERGKKSIIYAKHGQPVTSPLASRAIPSTVTKSSSSTPLLPPSTPPTPDSPEIGRARLKHIKRKVIDSDSEPEYAESDDKDDSDSGDANERAAFKYFNSATPEALQELTGTLAMLHNITHFVNLFSHAGCGIEQAKKIVELRPFKSIDDLNSKLGQGRKKAGPAGISSRMFQDCISIFAGYSTVDSIVTKCEKIAAILKAEIAKWTDGDIKGKGREGSSSRNSPVVTEVDGALSLGSQVALASNRPDYYISTQPSLLSSTVQLKDYQMIGINWLNLLYTKKLSCILADEMGLGKTVQVISFFAHLKEKGNKGPHLIVVP